MAVSRQLRAQTRAPVLWVRDSKADSQAGFPSTPITC